MLTRDEEIRLATLYRATGDLDARNQLIVAVYYYCLSRVSRFYGDDRHSIAGIAAIKTVDGFNPTRGCRLTTYATRIVRSIAFRWPNNGPVYIPPDSREKWGEQHSCQFSSAMFVPTCETEHVEYDLLWQAIDTLRKKERIVIDARINGADFIQIGELLGVSKQRAQQIWKGAIMKLRNKLRKDDWL